jgi:hypothetical protein
MIARATHQADEAVQAYTNEEIYGQTQIHLKHAVTQRVWQLRLDSQIDYVSAKHSHKILGPTASRGDPAFDSRICLFPAAHTQTPLYGYCKLIRRFPAARRRSPPGKPENDCQR